LYEIKKKRLCTFVGNKIHMNGVLLFRFLRSCIAIALVTSLTYRDLCAQGAFRIFDQYSNVIPLRINALADDSYRLSTWEPTSYGTVSKFYHTIHTTLDGTIIDSVTTTFPGWGAFSLNDDNYIFLSKLFLEAGEVQSIAIKLNAEHDTLWQCPFSVPPGQDLAEIYNVCVDSSGNHWLGGVLTTFSPTGDPQDRLFLLKTSPSGALLFADTLSIQFDEHGMGGFTMGPAHGGGVVVSFFGSTLGGHNTHIIRVNDDATVRWHTAFNNYTIDNFLGPAAGQWLTTAYQGLYLIDSTGQIQWSVDYQNNYTGSLRITGAFALQNDGWAVTGTKRLYLPPDSTIVYKRFVGRMSTSGEILWHKLYPEAFGRFDIGLESPLRQWIWSGLVSLPQGEFPTWVVMDSTGVIFPNHLGGTIRYDENIDCAVQADESILSGWVTRLEKDGYVRFASTDSAGRYFFEQVDTGISVVSLIPANWFYDACTPTVNAFVPADSADFTVNVDFPVQSQFDCPFMSVDIGVPFLRRCFNSTYTIHACNQGNVAAVNAYVEVALPPELVLQSVSAPYSLEGNFIVVQLGTVEPFECVDVQMVVNVDCDSAVLGQTLCVSAHILPDTLCGTLPDWSGALIEASGECAGDSVRLHLHNTGTAPSNALDFIVIDDHVMTYDGMATLAVGENREVFVAPADGSTWRLLAEQEPNAPPAAGLPTVAVEGCVADPDGIFSTGFVLEWPNSSGSPFFDRDCHEVVGSFDPNDKQAVPRGYGDEHAVYPNTKLEYQIRFQNTGTDTAFTVVIRDTLSAWLDPGSLRPGAASHPYTWELSGAGILTFRFENILLPDSNVNEAASHGFVQFTIEQLPDLPDGTFLENRAGIYFDFNEVVLTNTVFHTVGTDFLPVDTTLSSTYTAANAPLRVFPNPAGGTVWLDFEELPFANSRLAIVNTLGQTVRVLYPSASIVSIPRGQLPNGVYTVRWEGGNGQRRLGKIVWR
jgi:uncharacterized repeat protein (TIGR01451 family)